MGVSTRWYWEELSVSRVAQLDALLLNDQLKSLLKSSLFRMMQSFSEMMPIEGGEGSGEESRRVDNGARSYFQYLLNHYTKEIELLIDVLFWWMTIRNNTSTPGDVIQNLRYQNVRFLKVQHKEHLFTDMDSDLAELSSHIYGDEPTKGQRISALLLTSVLPYAFYKLTQQGQASSFGTPETLTLKGARIIMSGYELAHLLNLVVFIRYGRYRSISDRMIGVRLVPNEEAFLGTRPIAFEVINQQILYDQFTNMVMTIIKLGSFNRVLGLGNLVKLASWLTVRKLMLTLSRKLLGILALFQQRLIGWMSYLLPKKVSDQLSALDPRSRVRLYFMNRPVSEQVGKIYRTMRRYGSRLSARSAIWPTAAIDSSCKDGAEDVNKEARQAIGTKESSVTNKNREIACVFCEEEMISNSYVLSCGHFACYFCLLRAQTRSSYGMLGRSSSASFLCTLCSKQVEATSPGC